ncbi:unnamed protein product [Paramecium octaurelia]|uniref:Uncharacterized protein n=1 Tax=Paramecium octaurelia TaxID=43137 RepID=A0A8S1SCS9_PAROT|nr:unnamed protein product [Paramecium octaurelia]
MEFLSVNEQSKYDAHQQYQRQPDYQEDNQGAIQLHKGQFKIKLNSSKKQMLQPLQEIHQINAQTDRQLYCRSNNLSQKGTHLKTDNHLDILKSTSIQRILSKREVKPRMTKQLNEAQNKQKELELLQLMIKKHKENVQQYFPKKNRYLR